MTTMPTQRETNLTMELWKQAAAKMRYLHFSCRRGSTLHLKPSVEDSRTRKLIRWRRGSPLFSSRFLPVFRRLLELTFLFWGISQPLEQERLLQEQLRSNQRQYGLTTSHVANRLVMIPGWQVQS